MSCSDSLTAVKRVWYQQKLRGDVLQNALTDTTYRFRVYRASIPARIDSIGKVNFKLGRKEGIRTGVKRAVIWAGVIVVGKEVIKEAVKLFL